MRVSILLPNIFDHPFTYENGTSCFLEPGDFVKVPFGSREEVGVVWDFEQLSKKKIKLKYIKKKFDIPKLNLEMRKFITWFAKYNIVPLGLSLKMCLIKKNIVENSYDQEFEKFKIKNITKKYKLNTEQKKSLNFLEKNGNKYNVSVLEGLTGSGKTLVYFERIK